ncbi:MAG: radical SAM protein [Nanoarchaeota archaeon]|nr:radical SAM protein [Nanoarchaeota archaeon]
MNIADKAGYAATLGIRELSHNFSPAPSFVTINPTFSCNLKCKMCNYWKIRQKEELCAVKWKKAISELKAWLGYFHLSICGGEPLLRPDIEEIIAFASGNKLMINLMTNGTLLNNSRINSLQESGLTSVTISIDSGRKEFHDSLRGAAGTYDKVKEAIKDLRKTKMKIFLSSILIDPSPYSMRILLDMSKETDGIYFQPLMVRMPTQHPGDKKFCARLPEKRQAAEAIEILLKERSIGKIRNSLGQIRSMRRYYVEGIKEFPMLSCSSAHNLSISPKGDMYSCFFMGKIGNIGNGIKKSFMSDLGKKMRKDISTCKKSCIIMNCNYPENIGDRIRRFASIAH